ncbi:hypothetical protein [Streptomyces albidoflavus]|uniref:hypothetical protein n=1 Tax=Streptomyces albidoflavus TaxID=1886 RepID=UPI00340EE086
MTVGALLLAGCGTEVAPKPKLDDLTGKTYREAWSMVEGTDGITGTRTTTAEGVDTLRLSPEVRRNQDEWIVCTQNLRKELAGNRYRIDFVLAPTFNECSDKPSAPLPVGSPIEALTPPASSTAASIPSWAGVKKGMSEAEVSSTLGVELRDVCEADRSHSYSPDRYGLNCWIGEQEYGTLVFREGLAGKLYPMTRGLQAWLCCETGRPD